MKYPIQLHVFWSSMSPKWYAINDWPTRRIYWALGRLRIKCGRWGANGRRIRMWIDGDL